jgi:RHS repeat-associated protein
MESIGWRARVLRTIRGLGADRRRTGAAFVAVVLLCAAAAVLVFGAKPARSGAARPASRRAASNVTRREIPALRTATSRTYRLADGERETRVFQAPVNYREGDRWVPIGTELEEVPSGKVVNGDNRFDIVLPHRLGTEAVRLSTAGGWVSESPLGLSTDIVRMKGGEASYQFGDSGASVAFSGLSNGLKEDIVIPGPSMANTFHFALAASPGLTPRLEADGEISFRDGDGNQVATLPAPLMFDSAEVPAISDKAQYKLEKSSGGWALAVEPDAEWLASPNRVWPVTIDPSITVPTPNLDCSIDTGPYTELSLCGTTGWAYSGAYAKYHASTPDEYARSLYRFDVSSIPPAASISTATVGLYAPSTPQHIFEAELWKVEEPWTTSTTWKNRTSGVPWTREGGTANPLNPNVGIYGTSMTGPGWLKFSGSSLAALVEGWITGKVENDGVMLKLVDEKAHECTPTCIERFLEISSSVGSNDPYLAVTYIPQAPSGKMTSPTNGTRSSKWARLSASWTHSGVTGITFQYKGMFGWVDVPASKVTTKDGQSVTWPMPTEGAHNSEPLYWNVPEAEYPFPRIKGDIRAVFTGTPAAEGYSSGVEFELNRDLGGPGDGVTGIGPGVVDLMTGNLTVSRTDVSIPGFNSALEFTRTFNSRDAKAEEKGVLGPGWVPGATLETEGESAWKSATEETYVEEWIEEEVEENEEGEEEVVGYHIETVPYHYEVLTTLDGQQLSFEKQGTNFIAPAEMAGWTLVASGSELVLSEPTGTETLFESVGGNEYRPYAIVQPGGAGNRTTMIWSTAEGRLRLSTLIAPTTGGVSCPATAATTTVGCHVLKFTYKPATTWGGTATMGERLAAITYYAATSASTMGQWEVANYSYNSGGKLIEEWDPRISPALKETYTYETGGQLKTIKSAGEEAWTMTYGEIAGELSDGRLMSVSRPSLLASPTTATTTLAYNVPISGSGAPYEMGRTSVAQWGQRDVPSDATAIFPPDQVPASPPSSYSHATIYYMDVEGRIVNTATPSGAGTSNPSIATTESDEFGNVTRELTPQNRLRVLGVAEAEREKRWKELETKRQFSSDGTEMLEEWGPVHQVRLESGSTVQARLFRTVEYDQGMTPGTTPVPHLPTTEVTGALVGPTIYDQRTSKTGYDWVLRQPNEKIIDPGKSPEHLNLVSKVVYNDVSGVPTETRQPSDTKGEKAGTTKIFYYESGSPAGGVCSGSNWSRYAGLPCEIRPAAQPGTAGQPEILVRKFLAYDPLGSPTELTESPGGGAPNVRKTVVTYDAAGRQLTSKIEGGGSPIPKTETLYSTTMGMPVKQQFVCETGCSGITYSSTFGSSGTGSGQFAHPGDVVLDAKGNLWVADSNNNRLQEFNEKGEFIKSMGSVGTGNGQFKQPKSIAFTAAGNFWVADAANNRLQEFNEKGEFMKAVGSLGSGNGQFNGPEHVAIDAKGNLWVSDTYNYRIQELNENGEFVKVVNPTGLGAIEPTGITVGPGGNVWVTDWAHNRVVEINETGETLVRSFGTAGTGTGQFNHPDAVAIDPSAHVWIVDQTNQRVQEFDQEGKYLAQFGAAGTGAGQFAFGYPTGITTDTKGAIWVTDSNNNRIQKWVNSGSSFNSRASTSTYNALGQLTEYEDGDGNKTKTTYDIDGRPVTVADSKGSEALTYDANSGLLTKIEDSGAGTFTASYDADGNIVESTLPDGLTGTTTFNEADEATKLSYVKASSCGGSCTWLEEAVDRSIYGQILADAGSLVSNAYSYDKDGRLTSAQETPAGGTCTTRAYTFDADSNRLSKTVRGPAVGGACATSGGTEQKYEYDAADRLIGGGVEYDAFGRITKLPAADAGGQELATTYYGSDMVATQAQNGITNSYELDALGRQRARLQGGGGLEGTEIFHYDGANDGVAWTERAGSWARNVGGIGGQLVAIQESGSGVTLKLTDLHGDVVAAAAPSPTVTALKGAYVFDEFGEPTAGAAGRYGWLGGKGRRTELQSGVIQMGARSYVPALGRFLTPDPIFGGAANPYDYANQDPVNVFDLEGNCTTKKGCAAARRRARAAAARATARIRTRMRKLREKRAERAATASKTSVGPIQIHLPWEKEVNETLNFVQSKLAGVFKMGCEDAGGAVGVAGVGAFELGESLVGGTPGEKMIGGFLKGLGKTLGWIGVGLYAGAKLHIC